MKRGDWPAAIFAAVLTLTTLGLVLRGVLGAIADTVSDVVDAAADVATAAITGTTVVAALAVAGYFARDIVRIRWGARLEAARRVGESQR